EKRPRLAPEASGLAGFLLRGILLRLSVFARLQGLFHAAHSGSRGSVAGSKPASSGSVEPNEPPLPGLEHEALESLSREVELAYHLGVELHPALGDQAARLARREAEGVCEEGGHVNRIARGERVFGDLVGSLAEPHDAREVLLGCAGGLVPPGSADDEARELELRVHGIAARDAVALHHQAIPLVEERVGDAHRLAELLL